MPLTNALNLVIQGIRLGLPGFRPSSPFITGPAQQNRMFLKLNRSELQECSDFETLSYICCCQVQRNSNQMFFLDNAYFPLSKTGVI